MAKTIKASGLDSVLAQIMADELRPGEFTAQQAFYKHREMGGKKTLQSVRCFLQRLESAGDIKGRRIKINSKVTVAYSVP